MKRLKCWLLLIIVRYTSYRTSEFTIEFGPQEFIQSVLIADIKADGLLGNDFLKPSGCKVDYKKSCLKFGKTPIYWRELGVSNSVCRVEVAQTATIFPGEHMLLPGTVRKRGQLSLECMIQPNQTFIDKSGLMIGKSLVSANHNTVPLKVLNLSNRPQTIYQGTNAGLYHPVCGIVDKPQITTCQSVAAVDMATNGEHDRSHDLPEHIQDVFERSQ